MKKFLRSKEYWQVVSKDISEPAPDTTVSETQKTEIDRKDLKVKNNIFQSN